MLVLGLCTVHWPSQDVVDLDRETVVRVLCLTVLSQDGVVLAGRACRWLSLVVVVLGLGMVVLAGWWIETVEAH